jgi:diguanylate cyclase (GGDEF)-like protein/PAS domain S-box-containing protein
MAEAETFAGAFLEAAPDAVLALDESGHVILVNEQAERFLGAPRDQLWGVPLEQLLATSPASDGAPLVVPPSRPSNPRAVELFAHRRDGSWVPVEVSLAPVHVAGKRFSIAILRDLTERRRRESDLVYLSTHDALTGLVNRLAFDEALGRLDALGPHPVGVVMVDLDDLKRANDEHGHAAGDALLKRVAEVLRATFRVDDVIARIGGDEFAVLTAGKDAHSVQLLAMRLLDALQQHNREHDGLALKLSIGVAVAERGGSIGAALHDADARMYSMKRLHHGR